MKKNKFKILFISLSVTLVVLGTAAAFKNGFIGGSGKDKVNGKKQEVYGSVMDESDMGQVTNDDPWVEMEKLINVYYGGEQQISYTGTMRLMDDNEKEHKLLEQTDFQYSYFKGSYYYKMGQLECVKKDKFILMVNHSDKSISLSPILPALKGEETPLDMKSFREITLKGNATVKVMALGDLKIISVNNLQDPQVQGYQVFYDPTTYRIRKMIIGMIRLSPIDQDDPSVTLEVKKNESGGESSEETSDTEIAGYSYMLEIGYDKSELIPTEKNGFNPENKFIKFRDKGFELTTAYKTYQTGN